VYTLVAALVAPADFLFPALGALEERVALSGEPDAARRAYFVCHASAILFFIFKQSTIRMENRINVAVHRVPWT
jgi:hypothetical protein